MDLTILVKAMVTLAVTLITGYLIPWLKAKAGNENMTTMMQWVRIAVAAAEQIYESTEGTQKKHYVVEYLNERGIALDEEDLDNMIEAAVLELHTALAGGGDGKSE